jgi:hypothetical protein
LPASNNNWQTEKGFFFADVGDDYSSVFSVEGPFHAWLYTKTRKSELLAMGTGEMRRFI